MKRMKTRVTLIGGMGILMILPTNAAEANYDETRVPAYTLPDPLVFEDGTAVREPGQWPRRRQEILRLFETHVYGRSPGKPHEVHHEQATVDAKALGGKATRKQVTIRFSEQSGGPSMTLLLYVPNQVEGPVPAFLGLNFEGNHSLSTDPGIRLATSWVRNDEREGRVNHRATERSRGSAASRWPLEMILARGYAVATVYYGDIEPDHPEGWKAGARGAFEPRPGAPAELAENPVSEFADDAWGAIAAWAWGLSRALDYLETDHAIDARRVVVMGHSRLGKTALWAGATDERFAIVISNNSGCGGAALSRRAFGETVERINTSFPHWFCTNFKRYNGREAELPVDQHQLIALMAPRPVYVASAEKDLWADPRGEFLAAMAAEPVYRLLGCNGLGVDAMPGLNQPVGEFIGYHIRTGQHDVTDYDWQRYLDFADRHLKSTRR
jgi:hypothetical protein